MRFQCSSCGRIVAVDDIDAGIMVQCGHCGSVVQVPPTRLSRGSVIADFIIRRAIGQGGMGTVYLSHQITLEPNPTRTTPNSWRSSSRRRAPPPS